MSDLDLDALERRTAAGRWVPLDVFEQLALIAELRACRTERDEWKFNAVEMAKHHKYTEGLEASLDRERARAERAEAEAKLQRQNTMEALAEADEERAELDRTVTQLEKALARESIAVKRAERAEARVRDLEQNYSDCFRDMTSAEAICGDLEARIAAALTLCYQFPEGPTFMIRRALTGGDQ